MADYGSVDGITIEGAGLRGRIGDRVASASLDLSASSVSQLSLRVLDPELELLRSRALARKAAVTLGALRLQVAAEGVDPRGPIPAVTADCRPRAVAALRARRGARTWANLSPDALVRSEVLSVGARAMTEPRPRRRQIIRRAEANQPPESSWDLLARLAKEEGAWLFEAEGVVYWGRPTWLLSRLPVYRLDWHAPGTSGETSPALLDAPALRWSDDDSEVAASGTVRVLREQAQVLTPGRGLQLGGSLGPFSRRYIVTGLMLDVGAREATVSFESPVNPTPEPPA